MGPAKRARPGMPGQLMVKARRAEPSRLPLAALWNRQVWPERRAVSWISKIWPRPDR
jgi:hypothetical protein